MLCMQRSGAYGEVVFEQCAWFLYGGSKAKSRQSCKSERYELSPEFVRRSTQAC